MEKKKKIYAGIGFAISLWSLTTIIIPMLSVILVFLGVIFSFLGRGEFNKGITYSSIGMCLLAFIIDMIYLYMVIIGRA